MSYKRISPFFSIAPWLVVVFFVLKATVTGIWIVRPWDVPDEVGHFSYIKGLATGEGLPVLHETLIDEEVWQAFVKNGAPTPGENWIAQHPPLYHSVMVPFYWIGALFGSSLWGSFYLVRCATAVLFGLGIWVLMKAFQELGLSDGVALGMGILLASIPNHTYLAAAVNHDALVFFFGGLVLLFWVRFMKSDSSDGLVGLGLALGLGGLVKYTFLLLVPPLLLITIIEIIRRRSLSRAASVRYVLWVCLPIGIWMGRNLLEYGALLPVDTSGFQSEEPLEISFLQFGQTYPIFSILIQSYWGLLGWMGDRLLQVRWLQIYSVYQQSFAIPVIALLGLSMINLVKSSVRNRRRFVTGFIGLAIGLAFTLGSGWLNEEYIFYLPVLVLIPGIAGWGLADALYLSCVGQLNTNSKIESRCILISFFFLMVYLLSVYSFSVSSGVLVGTFGRYFLPVIGFVMVGFFSQGLRSSVIAAWLVLVSCIVYGCAELYVWLHEAIPFFGVYG